MGSGLDQVSEQLKKHRGDVLLTVAAIATAENKWRAIGQAVKDVAIARMIGPLAIVLGTLKGVEGVVRMILRDTGSLEAALQRLSKIQGLQRQFTGLLGSLSAAKQRVAELVRFTAGQKLFDLDESGRAARELEVLTRGAFAGRAALELLGNAAAASDNGLEAVASRVGQFHRELQEGLPIRATAIELAQMGVISQSAAERLAALQQNGAGSSDVFSALSAELAKADGALARHTESVDGVTAAYGKARQALAEKFGEPFQEAEITRMKDATTVLTALQEPVSELSQWLSKLVSPLEDVTGKFGAWLARLGLLQGGATAVLTVVKTLTVGLLSLGIAFGTKALGSFLLGIFRVAGESNKAATAMSSFRTAMQAASAATKALATGNVSLAAQEAAAGGAALKSAAAFGTAAIASNVLKVAIRGLIAGTGIGLLVVLIGYVSEKLMHWAQSSEKAAEAARDLAQAHRDVEEFLSRQIGEIRNLDDAQKALIDSTNELIAARRKLAELKLGKASAQEITEQERHIRTLEEKQGSLARGIDSGRFGVSQRRDEILRTQAARDLQLDVLARQNMIDRATGQEKLRLMEEERQRLAADAAEGRTMAEERARIEDAERSRAARAGGRIGAGLSLLNAQLRRASSSSIIREEQQLADMRRGRIGPLGRNFSPDEIQAKERALAVRRQRLEENQSQNEQGAQQLEHAIDAERKLQELHQRDLDAEREIGKLRDRGLDREETAAQERIDALYDQQRILRSFGDEQGADDLQPRIDAAERELRLAHQRAAVEREIEAARLKLIEKEAQATIAAAKGRFVEADRLRQEAIAEGDRMEQKRSREEKLNSGSYTAEQADAAVAQEQAQRERERRGQRNLYRLQKQVELRRGQLLLSDDPKAAADLVKLEDDNRFRAQIAEGLRAGLGAKEAVGLAFQQGNQDIQNDRLAPVVSSIQRIGGGGGMSDPVVSIAERQRALQERMVEYLATLAGDTRRDDTRPANEPTRDEY